MDLSNYGGSKQAYQPLNETALRFVADMERSGVKITRRAELPLMAQPAGASGKGRLTPCRGVECGLVGLTVAGSDAVEEDACQE